MERANVGEWVTVSSVGETVRAFVPTPLPPYPPLDLTSELQDRLDRALLALGRLDSITMLLPDVGLFLYMYVRKEAVLSSQIEGTQSSLSDLLLFELETAPGVPLDDVRDVSNYVAALDHGLKRLAEGFPLCLRLLREVHAKLLAGGRGSDKEPGEFRRSQNWIGGTRPGNATYVPPPPERLLECLGALEGILHDAPVRLPVLIKAALAHAQFESIHPFLDGNGRLGRLLITMLLCAEGALQHPLLYLSLYFKTHRQEYYDLLQRIRTTGDWEAWLGFFAVAVEETAGQAVAAVRRLNQMADTDRGRIQALGRISGSVLQVHRVLLAHPIVDAARVCEDAGIAPGTANKTLMALCDLGIVRELTGKQRNRVYAYQQYLDVLNEGTEVHH